MGRIMCGAASAVLVILVWVRTAWPCSCAYLPARLLAPSDGAGEVPIDVRILVEDGYDELEPRDYSYELQGPDGVVAAGLTDLSIGRVRELYPDSPLAPDTEYEVWSDGTRLGSFTTGSGPDEGAPAAPVIEAFTLGYVPIPDSSCGDLRTMELRVTAGEGELAWLVEFAGDPAIEVLFSAEDLAALDGGPFGGCGGPYVPFEAGQELCATVRARDLAGRLSPPVESCAVVSDCEPVDSPVAGTTCRPKSGSCSLTGGRPDGRLALALLLLAVSVGAGWRRARTAVE